MTNDKAAGRTTGDMHLIERAALERAMRLVVAG